MDESRNRLVLKAGDELKAIIDFVKPVDGDSIKAKSSTKKNKGNANLQDIEVKIGSSNADWK